MRGRKGGRGRGHYLLEARAYPDTDQVVLLFQINEPLGKLARKYERRKAVLLFLLLLLSRSSHR